jgi:SAM-dependent methyltransferase
VDDSQLAAGPHVGDAFGELLQACHGAGAPANEFFEHVERSDGFLAVGDAARYFRSDDWLAADVPFAAKLRGQVLDVGAGAGRVALGLQSAGLDVVALDVSPGALEVCHSRGVARSFLGTVHDLAEQSSDRFDTIVLAGNNLGLLAGRDEASGFLSSLARLATSSARIVGEITDPYQVEDPVHLAYHEQNRRAGRMAGQIRLRIRYRQMASPWFDYLFCTPAELEDLLQTSEWYLEEVHPRRREDGTPSAAWVAVLARR